MALRKYGSEPPEENHLLALAEVRRALFRLHKALVDAERAAMERASGPLTSGVFLQSLLQDPELAWLRPFSGLIVEIDEARAAEEAPTRREARDFIERVHDLVASADAESAVRHASRYGEASRRDSEVLLAHVELMSRIQEARREAGEERGEGGAEPQGE